MANNKYNSVPITAVHTNTDQEIIVTTADKLRIALNDHLKNYMVKDAWIAPLSLVVAIITAFCTADFKDAFGLKAAHWEAVFFIAFLVSVLWLFRTIYLCSNTPSEDDLLNKIKNQVAQSSQAAAPAAGGNP